MCYHFSKTKQVAVARERFYAGAEDGDREPAGSGLSREEEKKARDGQREQIPERPS